jgi:hypothetical protein
MNRNANGIRHQLTIRLQSLQNLAARDCASQHCHLELLDSVLQFMDSVYRFLPDALPRRANSFLPQRRREPFLL